MRRRIVLIVAGIVAVLVIAGGVKAAVHKKHDEAAGPGADRARAAALDYVTGGKVKEVEYEPEKGPAWEVEAERPNGDEVELLLNADYEVILVEKE
jgi:uncharacterized membrane protein YkoI